MSRTVSLHTLGCKLNHAETSAIGERFAGAGYGLVEFGGRSDIVVINSCSVTENADKECRQLVRRALRANPDAFVVVTGCYAQLQPEELASIEGVDLVAGSAEKYRLLEIESTFQKRGLATVAVGEISNADAFGPAFTGRLDGRTRSFLKVQDGCDYNCSFCTIPLARGASRSQSIAATIEQANRLVSDGYREIILTGVNVGDYDAPDGGDLLRLLQRLHDVEGLERLRVSSIEPNLLTPEIIKLAAESDRMAPHFHIPLQSGSDAVLSRMRRRYKSELYHERVEAIIAAMPDAAIGVDVIVGFPGETEEEFQATFEFLHALPVAYLHVFTYSERENTPAATFGEAVPVAERRRRTRQLRTLSEKKRGAFAMRFLGMVRPVLVESHDGGDHLEGYTDNYIRTSVPFDPALPGNIVPVRLDEFNGEVVLGTVCAR